VDNELQPVGIAEDSDKKMRWTPQDIRVLMEEVNKQGNY
jgi:hypothetical protein